MKTTIREEINNFKRLIGEATDTSSSGAYEQPLGFNQSQTPSPCAQKRQPLVGSEIGTNAPSIDVVDVTQGVVPMNEPTSYEGNMNTTQPGFDDMPFLSSHPSGWSFQGDEEEFLKSHGWDRPEGPTNMNDESAMSVAFDELDDEGEVGLDSDMEDEEEMSAAFEMLDDDTDVFNTLNMFTETKNGLGWK